LQKVVEGAATGKSQRFLGIAGGSASELEYHFALVHDLRFVTDTTLSHLNASVGEIKRMLASLIRKVEAERLAS